MAATLADGDDGPERDETAPVWGGLAWDEICEWTRRGVGGVVGGRNCNSLKKPTSLTLTPPMQFYSPSGSW